MFSISSKLLALDNFNYKISYSKNAYINLLTFLGT